MTIIKKWKKPIIYAGVALALGLVFFLALREQPIAVDLVTVSKSRMEVAIEREGIAQVREVYQIYAPIAGTLQRIAWEEGDKVSAGKSTIASILPLSSPLLDERSRQESIAAVEAGKSGVALAKLELRRAKTAFEFAASEYKRAQQLAKSEVISDSAFKQAKSEYDLREAAVASAAGSVRLREAELMGAKARLQAPSAGATDASCCLLLKAPVDGTILKLSVKNESVVAAGTLIAEVGNPEKMEAVVDLLSSDATKVVVGTPVVLSDWGGDETLNASVRHVDTTAFTNVSALGIEEQRVKVQIELERAPQRLGHGYRVMARLIIWSAENALQVPISSMFRHGGEWAVYLVKDGTAKVRKIDAGHINPTHAEVIKGLEEGDQVVLYPSDNLEDSSRVEARSTQK